MEAGSKKAHFLNIRLENSLVTFKKPVPKLPQPSLSSALLDRRLPLGENGGIFDQIHHLSPLLEQHEMIAAGQAAPNQMP